MTNQYCTGKTKDRTLGPVDSGIKTCKKARSVFYATMRSKGIDYTEVRQEDINKLKDVVNWYLEETLSTSEGKHPKWVRIAILSLKSKKTPPHLKASLRKRLENYFKKKGMKVNLQEVLQSGSIPSGLKPTQVYGRRQGKPKTCRERLISHFGAKKGESLYKQYGEDACKRFLPKRGAGLLQSEKVRSQ